MPVRCIDRVARRPHVRGWLVVAVLFGSVDALAQTTPVLVDRHITVGAGATIAVGAGDLVATLEAQVVPVRLFEEQGAPKRMANIGYRVAKLLLFDLPQESWLMVANHEVFGHGGRVRERFDGYLQVHLDAPEPYGDGGGVTFYQPDDGVTLHELQAVSIGGMEANAVGASLLSTRAFVERRLPPRAALRYLLFELDGFEYIQNTSDSPEAAGHDVSDFLVRYNLAGELVGAEPLSASQVRKESWVSLANPMVASAIYAIGRYLVTGEEDGRVFTLPIGPVEMMPGLRYRFTPFGTEWVVVTDVAYGQRTGQVSVRVGRAPLTQPWGIHGRVSAFTVKSWAVELGTGVWRQPPLALDPASDFGLSLVGEPLEWGGEVRGRVERPLFRVWGNPVPVSLVIDAAVKSSGFVPGDPLEGGLVFRVGLGLPLGRH